MKRMGGRFLWLEEEEGKAEGKKRRNQCLRWGIEMTKFIVEELGWCNLMMDWYT
jgi:hypothetical protein